MKRILALLIFASSVPLLGAELKSVSFFRNTVSDLDGRVLKFLTGSVWLLDQEIVALPLSEGTIICAGAAPKFDKEKMKEYVESLPKSGVFLYRGQTVGAKLVSGAFILRDGLLGQVVRSHGKGAILETDDGSLWSIPRYDQYDTGYWLPPYPVIIFKSELYLLGSSPIIVGEVRAFRSERV